MKFFFFKKTYTDEEQKLFNFLNRNVLFSCLEEEEKLRFLPYLHLRHYRAQEAIFFRGDPAQALYLIKTGRVSLTLDLRETFEEFQRARPGDAFGEESLLGGQHRIYNAVCASEEAQILLLPGSTIHEIFRKHADIKAKLLGALADLYLRQRTKLFDSYRSSFGFFELQQAYRQ